MAAYVLNRYFDAQELGSTRSRTIAVMTIATLISIGAGWAVDKLDGDAELHKNDPSIIEVVKSGDPMKIAKLLVGFN
ncbi:MAG: hypothetical protein WBL28_10945 [Methylotenera sp.]